MRRAAVSGHPTQTSWSVPEVQGSRAAQKSMEGLCYTYHIKEVKQLPRFQGR